MRLITKIGLIIALIASVAIAATTPKPLPKLVDLGTAWSTPCKSQKPIIEDLQENYKSKLEVVHIDVDNDKPAAAKYDIQTIPTQVFYDANGKQFYRHEGPISKADILAQFKARGYDLSK